jgi:hypothetical protein
MSTHGRKDREKGDLAGDTNTYWGTMDGRQHLHKAVFANWHSLVMRLVRDKEQPWQGPGCPEQHQEVYIALHTRSLRHDSHPLKHNSRRHPTTPIHTYTSPPKTQHHTTIISTRTNPQHRRNARSTASAAALACLASASCARSQMQVHALQLFQIRRVTRHKMQQLPRFRPLADIKNARVGKTTRGGGSIGMGGSAVTRA